MSQYYSTPVIKVRTQAQKLLYDNELCGQISDGHWENAIPSNHYHIMCDAEIIVAKPDEKIGANFTPKRRYNFANNEPLLFLLLLKN
jgi:hypothetical protein